MAEFVWLNDKLIPVDQARVSVKDRGFLFGDGLFETLRADAGKVQFLPEHLTRLENSARTLRLTFPGDVDWRGRLEALITANGLMQAPARLKILLTRGVAAALGLPSAIPPTQVIWAQPYVPPSPAEYAAGWPVVVFPEGRSSFLGRHKSLNYLFSLAARQYALDKGAKEAIILEADGRVSEAATANLLYCKAEQFLVPAAKSALAGVALTVLCRGLAARGYTVQSVPTLVDALQQAEGLWLTNSLMGLMPVKAINGTPIPPSPRNRLLNEIWAALIETDRKSRPSEG